MRSKCSQLNSEASVTCRQSLWTGLQVELEQSHSNPKGKSVGVRHLQVLQCKKSLYQMPSTPHPFPQGHITFSHSQTACLPTTLQKAPLNLSEHPRHPGWLCPCQPCKSCWATQRYLVAIESVVNGSAQDIQVMGIKVHTGMKICQNISIWGHVMFHSLQENNHAGQQELCATSPMSLCTADRAPWQVQLTRQHSLQISFGNLWAGVAHYRVGVWFLVAAIQSGMAHMLSNLQHLREPA